MDKDVSRINFREWNEGMAVKYNPEQFHNSKNILIRWVESRRVAKIIEAASRYKRKKVLEVGCGAGNILEQIPFDKLYGIDISEFLLERARSRLSGKAYLILGNCEELPYKDKSFDMVICTEVVEHTQNPRALLINIYNILNSRGKLIISFPNEWLINFLKDLYFCIFRANIPNRNPGYKIARRMDDEWHLHKFKITTLIKLLEKYFVITQIHRIPYYFLPIRYLVFCEKRNL